jgi:hypothetical protein
MATWASLEGETAAALESRCVRALGRAQRLRALVDRLENDLSLQWFMRKAKAEGCADLFRVRGHRLSFGETAVDTFLDLLEHRLYTAVTQTGEHVKRRADRFSTR